MYVIFDTRYGEFVSNDNVLVPMATPYFEEAFRFESFEAADLYRNEFGDEYGYYRFVDFVILQIV